MYEYSSANGNWRQLGYDIDVKSESDSSGWSVDLSDDGLAVAIGSVFKDLASGIMTDVGLVQVYTYHYQTDTWYRLGDNIIGEHNDDRLGSSISLSTDGRTIAIGAPYHDQHRGKASIYSYKESSTSWIKLGTDIIGDQPGDGFGHSVSISGNGSTVAVGAPYRKSRSGRVYVLQYKPYTQSWVQVGYNINGLVNDDYFGWSVSISIDGYTIASSAIFHDESGVDAGQVSVYSRKLVLNILNIKDGVILL